MRESPHTDKLGTSKFDLLWNEGSRLVDLHEQLSEDCADKPMQFPKIPKMHHKRTQEEIDEHEVTHYPWRAWCSC